MSLTAVHVRRRFRSNPNDAHCSTLSAPSCFRAAYVLPPFYCSPLPPGIADRFAFMATRAKRVHSSFGGALCQYQYVEASRGRIVDVDRAHHFSSIPNLLAGLFRPTLNLRATYSFRRTRMVGRELLQRNYRSLARFEPWPLRLPKEAPFNATYSQSNPLLCIEGTVKTRPAKSTGC